MLPFCMQGGGNTISAEDLVEKLRNLLAKDAPNLPVGSEGLTVAEIEQVVAAYANGVLGH